MPKPRDLIKYYGSKELFNEVKFLKRKIDIECPKPHRYKQLDAHFVRWRKFFEGEKYCKKSDCILDFGCAAGFSIFTANKLGFNNVHGLDIKNNFYVSIIKKVIKIIDVENKIIFYSGEAKLPFSNDYFDIILFADSIAKDSRCLYGIPKGLLNKRIEELIRISKEHAKWYIRPYSNLGDIKKICEFNKDIRFFDLDYRWTIK